MFVQRPHLRLDDDALLAECTVDLFRASGPGGQHRNKVTSGVRLVHEPTGVVATATERRSQHENRRNALRRLRMNLALETRRRFATDRPLPAELTDVLRTSKGGGKRRIQLGRKDRRFWTVAAEVLDLLNAVEGRLADAAGVLGVSTSHLVSFLKTERHLLAAAQKLRRAYGQKPIT